MVFSGILLTCWLAPHTKVKREEVGVHPKNDDAFRFVLGVRSSAGVSNG